VCPCLSIFSFQGSYWSVITVCEWIKKVGLKEWWSYRDHLDWQGTKQVRVTTLKGWATAILYPLQTQIESCVLANPYTVSHYFGFGSGCLCLSHLPCWENADNKIICSELFSGGFQLYLLTLAKNSNHLDFPNLS
jgi:hypothetical protein